MSILFSRRVNADVDDGVHVSVGSHIYADDSDPAVGYTAGTLVNFASWMVFRDVRIPPNAEIEFAIVRFHHFVGFDRSNVTVNTRIDAELTPNFGTMDHETFDGGSIQAGGHNRQRGNRTVALVDWDSIEATSAPGTSDTSDISAIIAELVQQPGWALGNDICLYIGDENERSTQVSETNRLYTGHETTPSQAPNLMVSYKGGGGGQVFQYGPAVIDMPDRVVLA